MRNVSKQIIIKPYVDYDGILTLEERKKILTRLESAFSWLGATIPEEIEINGKKIKLLKEIQNLIMNKVLTTSESERVKKLISVLENHEKFLKSIVSNDSISEKKAIEISDKICGILRAVHNLRVLIKEAPTAKALSAKQELMDNIEDNKRWIKYTKTIQ